MNQVPEFMKNRKWGILLRILAVLLGIAMGSFLVFQILFLSTVLPRGGLW